MGPRPRWIDPGRITVQSGTITSVAPATGPPPPAHEVRHLSGRVILPGFVNTHAHLLGALIRGLGGDRFLQGGHPLGRHIASAIRESLDEEAAYVATRLAVTELLRSGVTTTTDSQTANRGLEGASDGTLRALTESGIRARWSRASVEFGDLVPSHRHDSPDLAVQELSRLHEKWAGHLVGVGAEALSLHRVGEPFVRALHEWVSSVGTSFSMHMAYSEASARYPIDTYGRPLLLLLADWGVLDERFLGYHPVWLDRDEMRALTLSDAGVSLCSSANMLIGMRAAPLPQLLADQVRLGLGTDQPNDGHDFFATMKTTLLQQRAGVGDASFGDPLTMLQLATWGGARALHLEHRIGSIESGKAADLVVLDRRRSALNPVVGSISNIVLAAGPEVVESVFVDGNAVVEEGRVLAWESDRVVADANRVVGDVLERAGIDSESAVAWPLGVAE